MTLISCRTCGEEKPETEYLYRKTAGYRDVTCRSCKYTAKKRVPHYHLKAMLYMRRKDAAKFGVPFTITLEDLLPLPTHCPVLGLPLEHGDGGCKDNSPSIDRVNPTLGYVPGNVVVMSLKANRIKNDATLEELEAVTAFVRNHQHELPQA